MNDIEDFIRIILRIALAAVVVGAILYGLPKLPVFRKGAMARSQANSTQTVNFDAVAARHQHP